MNIEKDLDFDSVIELIHLDFNNNLQLVSK